MLITSASNPRIKKIGKIRQRKSEKNKVLLVGTKAIKTAQKKLPMHTYITTRKIGGRRPKAKKVLVVTKEIMKKITNVKSPQDVAAIFELPDENVKAAKYVLILDNIADPGNIGTIIRSATAFQFDLIICSKNSTDPYSEKALSAAKGATFFTPIKIFTEEEILDFIEENHLNVYLADIKGKPIGRVVFETPLSLIVSNEAHGPSDWAKKIAKHFTIPIKKEIDSLNAAIAASISMYEIKKI